MIMTMTMTADTPARRIILMATPMERQPKG